MLSGAAQAITQRFAPTNQPFSNFGRPTNAPPLVASPPAGATNRILMLTPDGRFVPAQ